MPLHCTALAKSLTKTKTNDLNVKINVCFYNMGSNCWGKSQGISLSDSIILVLWSACQVGK